MAVKSEQLRNLNGREKGCHVAESRWGLSVPRKFLNIFKEEEIEKLYSGNSQYQSSFTCRA